MYIKNSIHSPSMLSQFFNFKFVRKHSQYLPLSTTFPTLPRSEVTAFNAREAACKDYYQNNRDALSCIELTV